MMRWEDPSHSGRAITLLGADGSGKSTLAGRLEAALGGRARRVYLGSNPAAVTHALPTTRLWHALRSLRRGDRDRGGPPNPKGPRAPVSRVARLAQHAKSLVTLILRVSEDLYRLAVVRVLEERGYVVILDRHPYADYYVHRVAGSTGWRRIGDRVHGLLLEHAYPRPDRVVLLDAAAEILHARKPEGSLEAIAARRKEYRTVVRTLDRVIVLDTSRPEDEVFEDLRRLVETDPWAGTSVRSGPERRTEGPEPVAGERRPSRPTDIAASLQGIARRGRAPRSL